MFEFCVVYDNIISRHISIILLLLSFLFSLHIVLHIFRFMCCYLKNSSFSSFFLCHTFVCFCLYLHPVLHPVAISQFLHSLLFTFRFVFCDFICSFMSLFFPFKAPSLILFFRLLASFCIYFLV